MLVATTDGRALHYRPFWVVLLPGWLSLPTLLLVADAEPIPAARVSVSQPRSQDTSRMPLQEERRQRAYPGLKGEVTHSLFNPRTSTTFKLLNNIIDLIYASGRIKGVLGQDIIQPEAIQKFFQNAPFDGILGLGFPSLAIQGTTPHFDNLKKLGLIPYPLFAFYLSSWRENGSVLMFGGVDHSYHTGKLNWVPVSRTHYWQITIGRISMNGKLIACKRGCQAIMDTGILLGPSRHIAKIQRLIRIRPFGSLQYTVPCNITSTLPPLIFTIKGIDYPVPAQAYIHKSSQGLCYSTFQNGKQQKNEAETWVLGNSFLRLYFSVYDREKYRIGLAPAV
nr:PREDICTED: pepsin F-like [Bos mutus]